MAYRGKDWGEEYTVVQLLEEIKISEISKTTEKWCVHTNDTVMRHARNGMLKKLTLNGTGSGPNLTKRGSAIVRYALFSEIKQDNSNRRLITKVSDIESICISILNIGYTIDGKRYEEIDAYIDEMLEAVEDKNTHIKLNEIIDTIREAMKVVHYRPG